MQPSLLTFGEIEFENVGSNILCHYIHFVMSPKNIFFFVTASQQLPVSLSCQLLLLIVTW